MSLRLRIAAAGGVAVALAVLAAAVAIYLAVRSDLRGQIDQSLTQRAHEFVSVPLLRKQLGPTTGSGAQATGNGGTVAGGGATAPAGEPPHVVVLGGAALEQRLRKAGAQGPLPNFVQPGRFGGAAGYVQFLSPKGVVTVPGGQGTTPAIPPDARDRQIAASGHGSVLSDRTVKGTHLRVLTLGTPAAPTAPGTNPTGRGAVMIARPLTEVDHELHRVLLILLIVGIAGIAIAALLGALVARTALAPIARFTRRTESLAGELDLSQRLEVRGGEELERLATSFNTTLDALERSLEAQRQLIADASHELRTPIASLRANIQILEDARRLPPAEQERLHADIIDELDELTRLVGDVVELARGAGVSAAREEVRLDELVAEAVEHARRRGAVHFELDLEPTVVRGEADRIARAVTNLLDNARKWSPTGGMVEVTLHDGVLSVRDYGPGFAEGELAKVFERFYRSASARKLPGSGLGLAIVRQAAEAHGGYARAANAPGGGARLEASFGPALGPAPDAEPLLAAPGD
ncbi:MAG TPA: HAMP domain-containing sensor histidine kinase [Solirubrobacteraceae bacterium]|nr:HAMP domain-containing sensor histidine kinase [Solirubrobacteraceae bacterium]